MHKPNQKTCATCGKTFTPNAESLDEPECPACAAE
jgi:DNA-directed RNA polymerase subunit RPC12/RpoP